MIFTGFLPSATKKDLRIALSFLLLPWRWPRLIVGNASKQAEAWLCRYFDVSDAITFDSGRTALQKALEALGISKHDEVLVQSYTCVVVSNAIRWAGGTPIYVDVLNNTTMDPNDLEKKITPKSKVLIIQHTFGIPANTAALMAIAKKHHLQVIEDCAHALGVRADGVLLGTIGDIGMFSFGSDKPISCMRGGALITNNAHIAEKIRALRHALPRASRKKTIQYLLNYPIFSIGKPLYRFGIGKWFLAVMRDLHIIGRVVYRKEASGIQIVEYPSALPNALAEILLLQLQDLDATNAHRTIIGNMYAEKIAYPSIQPQAGEASFVPLRYPMFLSNPLALHRFAKTRGILLGNWYDTPIAPSVIDERVTGYTSGSCPNAERLAQQSVNLPTDKTISKKDAEKIIVCVNAFFHRKI